MRFLKKTPDGEKADVQGKKVIAARSEREKKQIAEALEELRVAISKEGHLAANEGKRVKEMEQDEERRRVARRGREESSSSSEDSGDDEEDEEDDDE